MKMGMRIEAKKALLALDKAGGPELTTALRRGYAAAGRAIRDKAKTTTAFRSRTGTAKLKSWRVAQLRKPYNHARIANLAFYSLFLEGAPLEYGFLEDAAEATSSEQLDAVSKAVIGHLRRLQSPSK